MKVLLINGSPHGKGCTNTALCEVEKEIVEAGIETEIVQIGQKPIRGCIGCDSCLESGKCIFGDDIVNDILEKAQTADGFIFGSPVHYAGASGSITCLLDRLFYAGKNFAYKPGACVVSARRSGTTAAFEQLNKYFTIRNMPIVSSNYWNGVHGITPEDVKKDLEGLQTMRNLGRNMAWLLKCIDAGKKTGILIPDQEEKIITNFI